MFNKKLIPIVTNIVISICLMINLFTPSSGSIVNGKCSTASSRYHICGCRSEAHSIDLCCCKEVSNKSEKSCTNSTDDIFGTIIQSLACAGTTDQYTAITYKISLPDDGILFQCLYRFNFIEWTQTSISSSITIPPPDKPPQIT